MSDPYFDKAYSDYWKNRVHNAVDGSKVPDETIERFFISKLNIKPTDTVLDLGCGHGRLHPLLREYTEHIEGSDINQAALEEAAAHPYTKLTVGSAEKTNLEPDRFDVIVGWAMYDGVEQDQGLIEENRILKTGGTLLITGKNKEYEEDDMVAFVAERNAKLKNFPNHFTDVYGLIRDAAMFGYTVLAGFGFARRGDFGEMKYFDLLQEPGKKFYEFLLILQKVGAPTVERKEICYEYSDTAKRAAQKNNSEDIKEFFRVHKETYGD